MKLYARTTGLSMSSFGRLAADFVAILVFTVWTITAMSQPVAAQGLVWAKRAGGTGSDVATGIALDGAGNTYVTGLFQGTATLGLGESNETALTSAGSDDIFVAQ